MDFTTVRLLETLLLPPAGPFLLAVPGLLLLHFRIGRNLLIASLLLLYLSSIPVVANSLLQGLIQQVPVSTDALTDADTQAIVVLGGGYYGEADEYGEATVGPFFLERLRYAAWVYRRTGIPIIVSSGSSDAHTAAQLLVEEFAVPVLAIEDRSWTTLDNAMHTAAILQEKSLSRVALITHGWHMPRALYSFRQAGVPGIIAAPMGLTDLPVAPLDWEQWIPSAWALARTRTALHEYLGLFWYHNQDKLGHLFHGDS